MRNLLPKLVKAVFFLLVLLTFVDLFAQKRFAPVAEPDIRYTIENDVQVAPNELQFDLYLLDTDDTQPFELSIIQAGIIVSGTAFAGGTVTASIVLGYSQLVPLQQPTSCVWATGTYGGCIKMTPKSAPGCGSGTVIQTTGFGTRVARIKLLNTVPFVINSKAGLTFNFTTSPYPTKVFRYLSCVSTQVTTDATNCFTGTTYQNLNLMDKIWKGLTSNEWNNTENWSQGTLPTAASNVSVPNTTALNSVPNFPVISTFNDVSGAAMTVESGAAATINSTASLTLSGILTLKGPLGMVIKSDASGTGSLKDNGIAGTGTAKVERYLTGYVNLNDRKYHFLSSPVSGQLIQPEFVLLPNTTDDFFKFSELSNKWINSKAEGGGWNPSFELSFALGAGYLVSYQNNVTKNFIGILQSTSSSQPINCTYTDPAANGAGGWNLIGNPYPSGLDWDLITKSTGIDNALYYYSSTDENYKYYISLPGIPGGQIGGGTKNIPAMQGFMTHAQPGGGTLTLSNSMRTHDGMSVYNKSTNAVLNNYLVLTTSGNGYSDQAYIYFTDQASQNFDGNLDAKKLMSMNPLVPMIYTITPDVTKLAINSLPPAASGTAMPLAFKAGVDGTYTITASELTTFHPDAIITLEDLKLGITHNLMLNPVYTFTAATTDITDRFLLHFSGTIGVEEQKAVSPVRIYSSDKTVYISCASGLNHGEVTISDLLGQQILSKNLDNGILNKITLNVANGYYIVRVQTESTVKTVKVYIK